MPDRHRNVAVLGSTGSIGRNTLDVIQDRGDQLTAVALSAHRQLRLLCRQANDHAVRWIIATDPDAAARFTWPDAPGKAEVLIGAEALCRIVARPEVDVVVAGIVGSAGLKSTLAAVGAGKTVALANKEALVMAGPLVMEMAQKCAARIVPVDSEHSAVFQCLQAGRRDEVCRVILTASGGPFRDYSQARLRDVTVPQALDHPTWKMGPKITVDSATMMNKALEIIEARWLFALDPDQIRVVVHPQSIIHSLVEFRDGSLIAQMSPPDMRLPIQYALTYPERWEGPAHRLDWTRNWHLELIPADLERFPALALGFEVARAGGTAGAVLNAANEAAVARFLDSQLGFTDIVRVCRAVLNQHEFDSNPTIDTLLALDRWAREEVSRWN